MNKRKKTILILSGIVIIGLVGIIRKITIDHLEIKEPIYYRYMVEHYLPTISDSATATSCMELMYVQNLSDKRVIQKVEFVDHPELKVTVLNRNDSDIKSFRIYKVVDQTLYLEWDTTKVASVPEKADIRAIEVTYSDESKQKVDIGRIVIYGGKSDEKVLEGISCVPLWEGRRVQDLKTNEKIQMEGLSEVSREFLQSVDILKSYSLKAGDRDITNETSDIKKGEKVVFSMELDGFDVEHFSETDTNYEYYQLVPQLIYRSESGKELTTDIYNYPMRKYFKDYKQVRSYVQERTGDN